jgi:hypothetical protein
MLSRTETLTWQFGPGLDGVPPVWAWAIVVLVAALGVALALRSYRHTLVVLPAGARGVLCLLRAGVWVPLLALLTGPTRIERTYQEPGTRPLAVLVDRSDSMSAPDSRDRRRVDDALRRWRGLEPVAREAFPELKTFAFGEKVQPVSGADARASIPSGRTALFASMQQLLAEAPAGGWGGIVTLTDGLDTAAPLPEEALDDTANRALTAGTPLYFVPGRNRYAGAPFVAMRELTVPGQAPPRSRFRVEAVLDSHQPAERTIEVELRVNGMARPSTPLRLAAGRHETTWSADIDSGEPGTIEVELHLGEEVALRQVRVTNPSGTRILYYQGALDWGYRFLATILERDPTFSLTPVFHFPDPNVALPPGARPSLPSSIRELQAYDIVILANVMASQLTAAQQQALSDWVREDGVVLFLTPDDDSTQGLAGSELEKMLPVTFVATSARRTTMAAPATRDRRYRRGSVNGNELSPDDTPPPKLTPFEWEPQSRAAEIFTEATQRGVTLGRPLFSAYARVEAAKPGAEVLARHPTAAAPGGREHAILLALQRYGRGYSGVLTSDALWRWKLSQPSEQRGVELFWQNLLNWLCRGRKAGLRFEQAPLRAAVAHECPLRVAGAAAGPVAVTARQGDRHVSLEESPGDGSPRVFTWTPPGEGVWQIEAHDAHGQQARTSISVKEAGAAGELSSAPTNEVVLRSLAARTGGAVIEREAPAAWQQARGAKRELVAEHRQALWNRGDILGLLVGLYATELILRRRWRLL